MVKRKLDNQEIEFTNKGIARIESENKDLEEQMKFNRLTMDFQEVSTKFQDEIRPYMRKKKEAEDEKVMGTLKEQLNGNRNLLENLKDQIEHGVTIKSIKPIESIKQDKEEENGE